MKLVIDIPENYYNYLMSLKLNDGEHLSYEMEMIKNGTPLPKGHGRLIDASNLLTITEYNGEYERTYVLDVDIENAPTIIEADTGEE